MGENEIPPSVTLLPFLIIVKICLSDETGAQVETSQEAEPGHGLKCGINVLRMLTKCSQNVYQML